LDRGIAQKEAVMADVTFEITKHFGVLSEEKSGWKKN